jgi:hypothetical protein
MSLSTITTEGHGEYRALYFPAFYFRALTLPVVIPTPSAAQAEESAFGEQVQLSLVSEIFDHNRTRLSPCG